MHPWMTQPCPDWPSAASNTGCGVDAGGRGHRRPPDRQKHSGTSTRRRPTAIRLARRSRRSHGGARRPRDPDRRRDTGHPGRSPTGARPDAGGQERGRPTPASGTVPAHRLRQPVADETHLRVPGRPRQLPHALAHDPSRATRPRTRRLVGTAAGDRPASMDRPAALPAA